LVVGARAGVRVRHLPESLPKPGGGGAQLLDLLPPPATCLLPGRGLVCHLVRVRVRVRARARARVRVALGVGAWGEGDC